jgi:hypothetical protein
MIAIPDSKELLPNAFRVYGIEEIEHASKTTSVCVAAGECLDNG